MVIGSHVTKIVYFLPDVPKDPLSPFSMQIHTTYRGSDDRTELSAFTEEINTALSFLQSSSVETNHGIKTFQLSVSLKKEYLIHCFIVSSLLIANVVIQLQVFKEEMRFVLAFIARFLAKFGRTSRLFLKHLFAQLNLSRQLEL